MWFSSVFQAKGIGVFGEDKGFHSTPLTHSSFAVAPRHLFAKGGESSYKRAYISLTSIRFLAINAKGGENISPKQKDRTTTNFKNVVFQFVLEEVFQLISYF